MVGTRVDLGHKVLHKGGLYGSVVCGSIPPFSQR